MFDTVKTFLEDNISYIESGDLETFFEFTETLNIRHIQQLSEILEQIGIDAVPIRWKVFSKFFVNSIQYYLGARPPITDAANSWSRLDYILEEIPTLGFTDKERKDFVLNNQKELGVSCNRISSDYGWSGPGDYDLGWLNKVKFKELYW